MGTEEKTLQKNPCLMTDEPTNDCSFNKRCLVVFIGTGGEFSII